MFLVTSSGQGICLGNFQQENETGRFLFQQENLLENISVAFNYGISFRIDILFYLHTLLAKILVIELFLIRKLVLVFS